MRLLLAEDDGALAEALRFALRRSAYAVDRVTDGQSADRILKSAVYDLLILDLGLPGLDGFEVLRRLRKRDSMLPVLILSAREKPEEKVLGLDLGADDYLSKPFSVNELQARVRSLLRRRHEAKNPVITHGRLRFDTVGRLVYVDGRVLDLSAHELGVLEMLLQRFGRVVGKEQLIERLYSYDREVGLNAIEVYVHRLRRKLDGCGLMVRTVYARGYMLDHPPEE
jgi:two-component system, OmpR family, response regulator